MYHFITGYTAKVAGTEVGVKDPEETFQPALAKYSFHYILLFMLTSWQRRWTNIKSMSGLSTLAGLAEDMELARE